MHFELFRLAERQQSVGMTTYRVVILGDGGVGKSCLTIKYTQDRFVTEYDPTVENTYRKQTRIDGEDVVIDILDTAGQEEYCILKDQYINSGEGFVCVYSITDNLSFDSIRGIFANITKVKQKDEPKVLVGNKADLERDRTVPTEKGQALADEFGIPFFETSAKSGENIEEAFSALIRNMKSNPPSSRTTPNSKHNKSHRSSTCTLL